MFDFNGKQVMYLLFEVIEPKYFMLNGKNAFPGVTYENFLIDVINCSHFFSEKRPIMEYYKLVEEQSNGEDDVYSSTYQLDFKLLVDTDVMRERNKNMPEVDYSQMSKGFIFTKTREKVSDIPPNNILNDIEECKMDDLRKEFYKNNTIASIVKNLKKPKNIFMYYPYEYVGVTKAMMGNFEERVTHIFENILTYRDGLCLQKDTFVCFKINQFFVILEWKNKHFVLKDSVDELLCANYRDVKQYSVY